MMQELLSKSEKKMGKAIAHLEEEYDTIRAGRANPAVLDKIRVNYFDTPTPINQLAAVSVPEARLLVIQPWDASVLRDIEKAIQQSDLGVNPQNDGRMLRLSFPQPTEERRKALVKEVSKLAEDCKVAIRAVRRDVIEKLKAMKKKNELTEDDLKDAEKDAQKLTDKYCKEADGVFAKKQKEIMEI